MRYPLNLALSHAGVRCGQAGLPALWTEDEQWYDRFGQAQSNRNASSSARGGVQPLAARLFC